MRLRDSQWQELLLSRVRDRRSERWEQQKQSGGREPVLLASLRALFPLHCPLRAHENRKGLEVSVSRHTHIGLGLLPAFLFSACIASVPISRLDSYVVSSTTPPQGSAAACIDREVGLLVINDTGGQGSLPPMSQGGLQNLAEQIKERAEQNLPIKVLKVATPRIGAGDTGGFSWKQAALEQGVDVLLLAVVSLVEVKSQDRLPLDGSQDGGGGMGMLPGSITSDYALVELGLLDAKANQLLVRAQGRGVATLEQLDSGLTSNAYPVIRQPGNVRRYFPAKDQESAQAMARAIAVGEALEQALYHLKPCAEL